MRAIMCLGSRNPDRPGPDRINPLAHTHSMNKGLSLALLVGGAILIIYGISASDSIGSGFSRLFTGAPTDKTIWLLLGGILAAGVGLMGMLRGAKSNF